MDSSGAGRGTAATEYGAQALDGQVYTLGEFEEWYGPLPGREIYHERILSQEAATEHPWAPPQPLLQEAVHPQPLPHQQPLPQEAAPQQPLPTRMAAPPWQSLYSRPPTGCFKRKSDHVEDGGSNDPDAATEHIGGDLVAAGSSSNGATEHISADVVTAGTNSDAATEHIRIAGYVCRATPINIDCENLASTEI